MSEKRDKIILINHNGCKSFVLFYVYFRVSLCFIRFSAERSRGEQPHDVCRSRREKWSVQSVERQTVPRDVCRQRHEKWHVQVSVISRETFAKHQRLKPISGISRLVQDFIRSSHARKDTQIPV